ncbi:MAD2L1-binding protein [Dionaea muscipula]
MAVIEEATTRGACMDNDRVDKDKYLKGYCCSPFIRTCPTYSTDGVTVCGDFPVPFCKELSLLDLYSGCGAMSTGLNYGAKLSGVDITTRWAVDFDSFACESLKLNHPETQVRNEAAEDFLELLKQWEILCKKYVVQGVERTFQSLTEVSTAVTKDMPSQSHDELATGEYEVMNLVDVSYGDPDESGKRGLKFKVRWKGYGSDKDTWEPIEGLSNCQELIQDFVTMGFKTRILPLPGDADVICGGPPCQGISGYNRFRSVDAPLDDDRNRQIIVFMDIVEFLKPKYVLMENVTDILRFDRASLGRYALNRLVHMHYQARVGIMAAGCYGLPQFRLRVFFWGALPSEDLPQFPLPTHDVVVRYWPPSEFERNVVGYDEGQPRELEDPVLLHHAISDLPPVRNDEVSDEMPYTKPPETEFQNFIRSTKTGISKAAEGVLYDHLPYKLFEDDYIRVCQIPRRKGANFRDLPGLIVGDDNVVRRDPTKDLALLPSGKPIVPDYVFTFEQGKSKRPFGRLWWDETLPTLITYPNCHSQKILHPEQDRLLTVRECARLQGFPDYYRLCGSVKKRYRQVGNAVPIPVGRALGYSLGMAYQKLAGKDPLMKLPPKFAYSHILPSSSS